MYLRKRKRSWARLTSKVWLDDPTLCSSCHKPMRIIAAISREQEDVIERVLRHLHLWDPPWKRSRKARGPPPSTSTSHTSHGASHGAVLSRTDALRQWFEEEAVEAEAGVEDEAIDQVLDDDLYAVDPAPEVDDEPPA